MQWRNKKGGQSVRSVMSERKSSTNEVGEVGRGQINWEFVSQGKENGFYSEYEKPQEGGEIV